MCLEARINGKIVQEQKLYLRNSFVSSEKFIPEKCSLKQISTWSFYLKKKIVMDVCARELSCSAMSDSLQHYGL